MLWKLGVILVLVCSQLMKKSLHIHYLCSLPKQLGGTAMSKCASKLWLYRHMVTSIQTSCFRLCACGWNPKKGNIALGLWQSWYIAHCKYHSNVTLHHVTLNLYISHRARIPYLQLREATILCQVLYGTIYHLRTVITCCVFTDLLQSLYRGLKVRRMVPQLRKEKQIRDVRMCTCAMNAIIF